MSRKLRSKIKRNAGCRWVKINIHKVLKGLDKIKIRTDLKSPVSAKTSVAWAVAFALTLSLSSSKPLQL